jgi:cell division initiation protein
MERFKTSLKGYNKEEVNKFVADCISQVEKMISDLKEKDCELAKLKSDLEKYKNMEDTFNKAILIAEDTSSQIRKLAKDESANIIADAKKNASRIVNEALMQAERTQMENAQLKRNIIAFKRRLRTILESQLDLVDDIEHLDM